MLFIIFLTGKCNLNCKYCGGSLPEEMMPSEITYDLELLKEFISKDNKPSIAFYGGEPLLRIELMKRIMDEIEARYIIQTNGLFLDKVPEEYINKFSSILVSIDGRKEINDFYRGETYDRVIKNVKKIKRFYKGEIIARMVASEKTDIFKDVVHLLNLNLFDYVHWQINAVWSPEGLWRDFKAWVQRYNKRITKLVDFWFKSMKKGKVLGIVPFLGVMKALLSEPNTSPPCGAGINSFAIATDGRVLACPICSEFKWNVLGNLNSDPRALIGKIEILEPCKSCELAKICGGRCLFFNRERLWGEEGFELVCSTARHLIKEIERIEPKVEKLIEKGTINKEELLYPKYNNTTEIIP